MEDAHEQSFIGLGLFACACSVRGASHAREETPCQDAYALFAASDDGKPLILAIADGHGDARHDQSQFGSRFAVGAAVDELSDLFVEFTPADTRVRNTRSHWGWASAHLLDPVRELLARRWSQADRRPPEVFRKSYSHLAHSFGTDFPRRLQRWWNELVRTDSESRGLNTGSAAEDESVFSRYGTTLLVAMVTPELLLLGQLGDGDLLLVGPDGTVESPLPRAPDLIGNSTYSLSTSDAPRLWVTACIARPRAGLLLLSSDGLANSFASDESFYQFARSLRSRIREFGAEAVASQLRGWLERYSEEGSGDDITIALVDFTEEMSVAAGGPSTEDSPSCEPDAIGGSE